MKNIIKKDAKYIGIMLGLQSFIFILIFNKYMFGGYYFVNKTVLGDVLKVFLPVYYHYYDVLHDGIGLWSWRMGIGTSMFSHADCFFDPFTYILYIRGREYIPNMLIWLFAIKLMFESLSMYYYLSYFKLDKRGIVYASICYAMCGYSLTLGSDFPLGTVLVYTPLVFRGLEQWIDSRKKILLISSLTALALYNYYFFYIIGIICPIYVFLRLWNEKRKALLIVSKLVGIGVVVCLLAAVSLLPQAQLVLRSPRVAGKHDINSFAYLFIPSIRNLFTNLLRTVHLDILGNINTNNYIGVTCVGDNDFLQNSLYVSFFFQVILVQLIYLYREKRANIVRILVVSIVVSVFPVFSYVFNFFSTINARWMLVFSILESIVIALGIDQIIKKGVNHRALLYSILGIVLEIPVGVAVIGGSHRFMQVLKTWFYTTWKIYTVVILLCVVCFAIEYYTLCHRRIIVYGMLTIVLVVDLYSNYRWTYNNSASICEYSEDNHTNYLDTSAMIIDQIKSDDTNFYRINKDFDSVYANGAASDNDALVQNYMGLKSYNSLNNSSYLELLRTLNIIVAYPSMVGEYEKQGVDANEIIGSHLNFINGVYDHYNLMNYLGVKYHLTKEDFVSKQSNFVKIDNRAGINVFKNNNVYPLCFVNNELLGEEEFYKLSYSQREKALLKYTIVNSNSNSTPISFYTDKQVNEVAKKKRDAFHLISFKENLIKFDIEVEKDDSILSCTIPFEPDWNIYIDGIKVKNEKINIALLGTKIDSGFHHVELVYKPLAFIIGIHISIVSLLLLLCIGYIQYRRRCINDAKEKV